MKKSKIITIIVLIFLTFLIGCSLCGDTANTRTIKDPSEMPEIVFVYRTYHYNIAESRYDVLCDISFCDKNGNFYISKHTELDGLSTEEFIKEYMAGNLKEQIELYMTVDSEEVFKNYKKLCKVSKNSEFEIVRPGYGPENIVDEEQWYGIYYDKEGNIQTLIFHEGDAHGSHYSNDESANEIYEWYTEAFKKYKVALEEPFDEGRLDDLNEIGIKYYKNQLVISVLADTDRCEVEETAKYYGAEILSFDEKKKEYIIEFKEEKTNEDLIDIYNQIIYYPFVNWVSLHFY